MKATLSAIQHSNGRNYGDKKELVDALSAVGIMADGTMAELVSARCYMGRSSGSSVVYASVWLHGRSFYSAGTGKAGGGGYCKRSAAMGSAFSSAGVTLSEDIEGRGMGAVRNALEAVAVAMGAVSVLIVEH